VRKGSRSYLTPESIRLAVESASTLDLVLALPARSEMTALSWEGHCEAMGDSSYFPCPVCDPERERLSPWARLVDSIRWRCEACRSTGTRWQLERLILDNPDLLEAFLARTEIGRWST
jgi:hypothetical protein